MSTSRKPTTLALENGLIFRGTSFGIEEEVRGEVVFNTSHFGYQEILTDPSYVGQIVTMSAPQMGNVGANFLDEESARPYAAGMVIKQLSEFPSNWRATQSLHEYLAAHQVGGIEGIDTRALVTHLRTHGSCQGVLTTERLSDAALLERARSVPSMEGQDLVSGISTRKIFEYAPVFPNVKRPTPDLHVVAYDFGAKRAMFDLLVEGGCRLTVVPYDTPAEKVLALKPDGVFLSNGPGDPAAVPGAQKAVAQLIGQVPIFGICLGHQILALAVGAKTYKMKFGHRGANQPVKDLRTGKIEITSQNHGFAVDPHGLGDRAEVTHLNLNDGTVEGIRLKDAYAFSVQHHPESSPGPQDSRHLFDRFLRDLREMRR
jgi:carbamoyl-phosphate synthase small subunit